MKKIKYFALLTALAALFAVMSVAAFAADPETDPFDMSLVFSPETQLVVYVDGAWSADLSDTYGYGETVMLSAPSVSGKSFSHWEADGSIVSYAKELNLTVNANTTLYAVYANTDTTAKPVAGFTSITRSADGNSIALHAIASGDTAGFVYSTKTTGDNLKIGGTDVTNVEAEELTADSTKIPQSVIDNNNCYMLKIKPNSEDTVYYVRAYVTVGGETVYGDVKDVSLSELKCGVTMVANLEGFEQGINDVLAGLTEDMRTVMFYPNGGVGSPIAQAFKGESVTLRLNTFTREGYTFNGWNTSADSKGTAYTDGATVTLSADTTLYAQWSSNTGGDNSGYVGGGTTTYAPTVSKAENGTVSVSPTSPKAGDKVTITAEPDEGYEVDTVTVKDANGKAVEVTKNADGTYTFTQPSGKVTIDATFKETKAKDTACPKDGACPLAAFTDLDPAAWYHDGVEYCLQNGLMNGVGNGKFDPNGATSRAMIVTILYRLENEPAVTAANPFTDVAAGQWYTDAVIWASVNNIVAGYGDGRFGPDDAITREQLATILYRYAQSKGEGFKGLWSFKLDFPDAADVSDWANEAMSWMVMNGIINGKDGKLVPKGEASRAEAATMLQRFCAKLAEAK